MKTLRKRLGWRGIAETFQLRLIVDELRDWRERSAQIRSANRVLAEERPVSRSASQAVVRFECNRPARFGSAAGQPCAAVRPREKRQGSRCVHSPFAIDDAWRKKCAVEQYLELQRNASRTGNGQRKLRRPGFDRGTCQPRGPFCLRGGRDGGKQDHRARRQNRGRVAGFHERRITSHRWRSNS